MHVVEPRVVWVLLGVVACGPSLSEPPPLQHLETLELLPVCGQPSPLRLLALDESETPVEKEWAVYRFEDRLYILVGRANEEVGSDLDPYWLGMETTLYSTGLCGESPRVIASDIWEVLEHPRWPGWLLGLTQRGDLVVLDPEGEVEPGLLLEDESPDRRWTERGILQIDDERGALVLRPYPSSPDDPELEPTVVVEPFSSDVAWRSLGDDVFFVEDGALQRVDLRDGSRALELDRDGDIEHFRLIADGRFFVLESPPDADGFRSLELYDRLMGVGEWIGDVEETYSIDHEDHLVLQPRDLPEGSNRLVLLPSMEQIDVPPDVGLQARIDDTRWLAWRDEGFLVYDRTTNAARLLFDWTGQDMEAWYYDDRVEVLVHHWSSQQFGAEGPVYAVWLDERSRDRIADQATIGLHHLADGRIVTPLDVHDDVLGTLALTGLDGVTRWEIDGEVVAWFGEFQAAAGLEDDVVVYGVSDGERSGVWVARLPAAE